ncbi:GNAT family N-acetyltransferase [Methanoregula formicica]|uniref:Acetyltransferase (GNAT) family protein n=1 Tax=Methanoregula formicica (strain DSM 22288 / NBRC 105244 / SMSP) TaxID=593750 RepID=L0HFW1_METFS|nr:GNAT family N-acetyltransferase [Methanoregula formicica]AGB02915.1 acetyltransferase (GNAT) family protein [Methanoregula formicica SMSP]
MPTITAPAESDRYNEDLTLLTLYSLAGEESSGFLAIRPHFIRHLGKVIFSEKTMPSAERMVEAVTVRELTSAEMVRAERELWIHYHQQKADPLHDRLFAVFSGQRIIGVARCSRHEDGLEVDAVYVLEEYRLRGFARSVMILLIEECGRNETLYMHSKTELVNFYGSLGFRLIPEADLPTSIRDRFDFVFGDLDSIQVTPMRREPGEPDTVPATP